MIPSLLQIPSAVSDSKLHSVLPNNGKGDFTFDRSTGATRINKDGLIEEVGYFSSELVQNGNFSELGSELIVNGDFVTDSDWTKGTGWIINDGKAINTGGANFSDLTQNNTNVTIGKTYKITYTISDYTSGSIKFIMNNNSAAGVERNANGTYTDYISALSQGYSFRTQGSGFIGKIDNVSVKQVDPNDRWTTSLAKNVSGWLIENDVASCDGTQSTNSGFIQASVFESGKNYMLKFDLTSNGQDIKFWVNGSQNIFSAALASGSYKYEFTTTVGGSAYFEATANFVGTLDNVSIVEVQGDRPRLSYDITNGVVEDKPHLLLEPSATNLLPFSEDFTQWTNQNTIDVANQITSPDGNNKGTKLESTSTSSNYIYRQITLSTSTAYSISVFVKKGTSNIARLDIFDTVGGTEASIRINLDTEATSFINGTASFKKFPNDWYKLKVSFTSSSSLGTSFYRVFQESGVSGQYIYVFGAQLEQQAYCTSYIPTAGTTITRAAETCNNSKPSVNSTEGVLYAEIARPVNDSVIRSIALSDNSLSDVVLIQYYNNNIGVVVKVGSAAQAVFAVSNTDLNLNKIAISWAVNNFKVYVNGSLAGTDTSGSTFSAGTLTTLSFDNGGGSEDYYGKVKGLAVYNEALSESQLMQLTGVTASSIYNNFVTRTASFTVEALNEVKKVIDNL